MKDFLNRYKDMPVQIRASFWFMICLFLQRGISAITTPIFTRLLTTEDYGIYGAYTSWLEIISVLVTLNLFAGVYTQGLVKYADERNSFSANMQTLLLSLCLLWSLVYVMFRPFWNRLFSLSTLQMTGLLLTIWCEATFSLWAGEQRVRYTYKALITITLLASILKPLLGILLIIRFPEQGATARIWGVALADLLCYSWLFFVQLRKGNSLASVRWWRYALGYNVPLIPHFLSQMVMTSSDRIMIRELTGASEAGIYDLANTISNIMALFSSAILQTLNPWIFEKIREKQTDRIRQIADPSLVVIAIVNLLLIAMAPELVWIFAPKNYYDAIWVIPPITMGVYFRFAYNLFADFSLYYEKVGRIAFASIFGAVVNVILNLLLIPRYGYYVAGYTTLLSFFIYSATQYLFMTGICRSELGARQPYQLRFLLVVTSSFIGAGFLFMALYHHPVMRFGLLAVFVCGILLYRDKLMVVIRPKIRKNISHNSD